MDQNNSFLLQKQVRDNSEDLQKELLDLKNWEQEMKRKEAALLNSIGENTSVLPPIRSKKKKTIESSPPIASTSNSSLPDRIKSYDYSAWDKFDVDEACRKLEDENESDGSVEDLQESAEKLHTKATKFKDRGNIHVQSKKYDEAIECYSEAIKLFPYDEVFYANRALCYLKMENLHSAEADCTTALQLNDCYVKAYHRRATARMKKEEYAAAKEDIQRILNFEPTNKEAKSMLAQVNKKLEKLEPLLSSNSTSRASVENKIGQKLWNVDKLKEQTKIQKQQIIEIKNMKESSKGTKLKITEISNETEEELPHWLPKLDENYSIVKPAELSPHQRSQKTLKRVPIKEVDFGKHILPQLTKEGPNKVEKIEERKAENNVEVQVEEIKVNKEEGLVKKVETSVDHQSLVKNTTLEKPPKILQKLIQERNQNEIKKSTSPKIIEIVEESPEKIEECVQETCQKSENKIEEKGTIEVINSTVKVAPAPKTSVQFIMEWKRNKSLQFRYAYLKQIPPETLPKLFKDSMESNILGDIIDVLQKEFSSKDSNIFQYLEELSKVKRFRTLIMFIEESNKKALKELLAHCRRKEGKSEEEIDELRKKYEL